MKHKGPVITLLAGLVVAAVLMALNLAVTAPDEAGDPTNAAPSTDASPDPAATTAAVPTPAAAPTEQITYAGWVAGGGATIAIAIKNGTAVAYLCDGRSTEAWLQGSAANGRLDLSGARSARLTGSYGNGTATGTVVAAGREWAFSIRTVTKPSGLYRTTANVRNAKVVGGWIVLADGTQVGLLVIGDASQPAPALDLTDNTAIVDGTEVTAALVEGTGL